MSVVTRSGTNQIHGSVFEFLRNSAFAAKDFLRSLGAIPCWFSISTADRWVVRSSAIGRGSLARTSAPVIRQDTVLCSRPFRPQLMRNVYFHLGDLRSLYHRPERYRPPRTLVPEQRDSGRDDSTPLAKSTCQTVTRCRTCRARRTTSFARRLSPPTWTTPRFAAIQVSSKDTMFARFSLNDSTTHGEPSLPPARPRPPSIRTACYTSAMDTRGFSARRLVNEFRFAWSRPTITKDARSPRMRSCPARSQPVSTAALRLSASPDSRNSGQQPPGLQNVPLGQEFRGLGVLGQCHQDVRREHLLKFGFTHQFLKFRTLAALQGRGASPSTAATRRTRNRATIRGRGWPTCCWVMRNR